MCLTLVPGYQVLSTDCASRQARRDTGSSPRPIRKKTNLNSQRFELDPRKYVAEIEKK
jgi:hypothetical protein